MKKFIFLAVFSMGVLIATADTIYVNSNAAPGGTGIIDWDDAFNNLQDAIDAAQSGDEIWVMYSDPNDPNDVYTPTQYISPWGRVFYINSNIAIYGGFTGTESSLSARDPNNRSILNGNNDNILIIESENVILDGFEINGNILSKYGVTINGEFLQANK